jgi:hypothetical protein
MAEDSSKTALEAQIQQEAKELAGVPKIPIQTFMGAIKRCHICGQISSAEELKPFDTHIDPSLAREACPNCHPHRGR